jgi:hypothetical protein
MKSGPFSALDLIDSQEAFYATPLGTEINDDLAHMSLEKVATLPLQSDGLPSWVPAWNKPVTRASFLKYIPNRPIEDDFAYAASGRDPRPFLQGSTCLFDVRGQELHVRAFRVDVVKQLAPLFFISPSWHSQKDEDAIWAKIQEQVDLNITYEQTNESMVHALRRTVTADLVVEGNALTRRPQQESVKEVEGTTTMNWTREACIDRALATTATRLMGLVPRTARVGDEIFVLAGGQVLHVLRPVGECFQYIGESYVHGLMDGEALQRLDDGTTKVETVRII